MRMDRIKEGRIYTKPNPSRKYIQMQKMKEGVQEKISEIVEENVELSYSVINLSSCKKKKYISQEYPG